MMRRELSATAALLLSLPAMAADSRNPAQLTSGADIYREVCQACHMPKGVGATSPTVRVPALANNPTLGAAVYPITVVLNGRAGMPWFNGTLTAAQIASVITFVRMNFGNNFPAPVTEQQVKALATAPPAAEF